MQRQTMWPTTPSLLRGAIATWVCAAFLSALALSVSPRWHELLHLDAKASQHECAVTLIGSGSCQYTATTPLPTAPVLAAQFSFVLGLHPVWVASPFLGARIFEHAPPAVA